jgi:hypothetical protein
VAVAAADVDAVPQPHVAVPPEAEAALTIALRAKVIRLANPAIGPSLPTAKKMNFANGRPNARKVLVTKTKTFRPLWMKLPKAKAFPKSPRTNRRTRPTNFTKNALKPIASVRLKGYARSAAPNVSGAVSRIAGMIAAAAIETGIVIATGDAAAPTNATGHSTAFYAAKSIAFATAWKPSCAISNASSARSNKPNTNAS